jgi:hypothetical protein
MGIVAVCGGISVGGCGGRRNSGSIDAVRDRAGFDLQCDQQISVQEIGRGAYGARGCGRQASYVTMCNGYGGGCRAVLNSEEQ